MFAVEDSGPGARWPSRFKAVVVILFVVILAESAIIVLPRLPQASPTLSLGPPQSYTYPYRVFNQPISNDTDQELQPGYPGSWVVQIRSSLIATPSSSSEAQVALAPNYKQENLSIPTIVVQERTDGLLRIEYYAQNWNNTYGLLLYNSTSPTWLGGDNVTLQFNIFGPPSSVNPPVAPRPNGNLTITVGATAVLSDYPIAWASLAHIYVYGLRGSSFSEGDIAITFRSIGGG